MAMKMGAGLIAQSILNKAKSKKMAQGGWVEEESVPRPEASHPEKKHYLEEENVMPDVSGRGFSRERDLGPGHSDKYDVQPEKFNEGGMCYAHGGGVHPLAMLLKERAMKKLAYGGIIDGEPENDGQELSEAGEFDMKNYGPYLEQNEQTEARMEGTKSPAITEAPQKDEDRIALLRHLAVKRAMR